MTATFTAPRSFTQYVELHAADAAPEMVSGLYESVDEFAALEVQLHAGAAAPVELLEPKPSNEWVAAGYALAIAYQAADADDAHPFVLAVYVEGDVRRYRFAELERAVHAGRYWAVGLI